MTKKKKIEDSFQSLKPLEHIRLRSGMYIGSNTNPDVLLRECIDNSIDECLGNFANEINVFSNRGIDDSYSGVFDNGRGVPITLKEFNGKMKPIIQVACSEVNSGSKFNNSESDGSIGLNGVGIKATNALSTDFYIMSKITSENYNKSVPSVKTAWENNTDNKNLYYGFHYQKGELIEDFVSTIEEINSKLQLNLLDGYSTYTIFQPDESIFHNVKVTVPVKNFYYLDAIMKYFYHRSNLTVSVNGKTLTHNSFQPYKYTFCKTIDLESWKTADERFRDRMNKKLSLLVTFEFDPELRDMNSEGSVNSLSCWGKNTKLGEQIVTQGLKNYFGISHNYLTLGLKIVTIMMIGEAEFDSQTKNQLTGIPGLGRNDWTKFSDEMHQICKNNPEISEHIALLNQYAAQMKALTTQDLVKSKVYVEGDGTKANHKLLPVKLRDALSKNREDCILFIVEGDSAGNGLIKTRDPLTMGVLPLRGVPLNSTNLDISEVLENQEMCDMFSAIGMGAGDYTTTKRRYSKLIIAADADIDGYKISCLILGALLKHNPQVFDMDMVYLANAPLYKQGDKFIWDEADLDKKKPYKRYKGLGEMNSDEVHEALVNPKLCRYIKVTKEGAEYALRLISNKDARKDLMREIGCLSEILDIA